MKDEIKNNINKDYAKYKWFFTSSEKLVIGGKNASQNDQLLKKIKSLGGEYIIMHTSQPGSPFSVILSDIKSISSTDIGECAIFTACFSQSWKSGKRKARVDIFNSSQINKSSSMKVGTWGVKGKVKKMEVNLELVLTVQKGILRSVPEKTIKNKGKILLKILPGNKNKEELLSEIHASLKERFSKNDILSALPSGGLQLLK